MGMGMGMGILYFVAHEEDTWSQNKEWKGAVSKGFFIL
jgi:hypothetical protein